MVHLELTLYICGSKVKVSGHPCYICCYIDLARRELRVVMRREIRGLVMKLRLEMKLGRILEMWVEENFSLFFVDLGI